MDGGKQLVNDPKLQAGVMVIINSIKVRGEGTISINLKSMCPVSTLDLRLEQHAVIITQGQPDQKMIMKVDAKTLIKPSHAE